jgi:hypothetical protein
VKLIIKLLNHWRILPWFHGGADAAHSFHEAIGTILGNEVYNTRKRSRAFVNVTPLHVGFAKLQFGHRNIGVPIQRRIGRNCIVEFQRFANNFHRVGCPVELK